MDLKRRSRIVVYSLMAVLVLMYSVAAVEIFNSTTPIQVNYVESDGTPISDANCSIEIYDKSFQLVKPLSSMKEEKKGVYVHESNISTGEYIAVLNCADELGTTKAGLEVEYTQTIQTIGGEDWGQEGEIIQEPTPAFNPLNPEDLKNRVFSWVDLSMLIGLFESIVSQTFGALLIGTALTGVLVVLFVCVCELIFIVAAFVLNRENGAMSGFGAFIGYNITLLTFFFNIVAVIWNVLVTIADMIIPDWL